MRAIRVGSRGSALALAQTKAVIRALESAVQGFTAELVVIRTTGDIRAGVPLGEVGVKGMFVKEIEEALLSGEIDVAIHSLKDMPSDQPACLILAATPKREDPRDALISRGPRLMDLPPGARVGTSSTRRQAMISAARPDLAIEELRGNLDTRIRKLDEGQYDAIVVAYAGLARMGWMHRITEGIPIDICVPAPGQGALALECRESDSDIRDLLVALNDSDSADEAAAERSFQSALGAGCSVPAGCCARVAGDEITVHAAIAGEDRHVKRVTLSGSRSDAAKLGMEAARNLTA